ncbi:MAG TPA: two-component regulator propeller domain-containing protein [Saprospiraceae bacterium]|nr:two-component regulator propeller domain-containing protein [Saprospiraceae bacterium]
MKWISYFVAIWALSGCILQAQTPAILHFGIDDGLSGNLVYCAAQDHQGYVWFGTDKGLSRFDGQGFFSYSTDDGLPDPEVLNLHQDLSGRLWIACFRQKPAYRLQGRFITEKEDTLLNRLTMKNAGYVFSETADSTLWISSGGVFSRKNGIQTHHSLHNIDAVVTVQGQMLGLNGSKIYLIKGGEHSSLYLSDKIHTHQKWAGSFSWSGNRFLFAFPDFTMLMEYREGKMVELERISTVFQTVYTDRLGRFWGAAPGKGVVCFDNSEKSLDRPVWSLKGKKISGIYHDLQGNFWFLSSGEGLYLRPAHQAWQWDMASGVPSSNFRCLQLSPEGMVLAGDDLGNVHSLSNGKLVRTRSFGVSDGTNFVRQLLPSRLNTFWVVSDEGFYHENQTIKPALWQSDKEILNGGAPKCMASIGNTLWFGSSQGIASWIPELQKMPQLVKKGRVTAMAVDSTQQLWVGGIDGLYHQAQHFQFNWGDRFELLKQRIVGLVPGGKHHLWAITPQAGLLKLSISEGEIQGVTQTFIHQHLSVKDIKKVFPANDGSLWLATNQGVFQYQSSDRITRFSIGQGLAGTEVNDLLIWHDTLWVATNNGLSLIDLKTTKSSENITANISHIKYQIGESSVLCDLANGSNLPQHQLVLPSDARQISIWYVGLRANPGDFQAYQHRQKVALLPFPWFTFPNIWRTLWGSTDTIWLQKPNYDFGHKLEAGRYIIHSTLYSFDGKSSTQGADLVLTVLPHWTETIWVWLAIMLVITYLLSLFYSMRMQYIRAEAKLFQLKHQALKARINPHFVGNSINAIQKFFYPPDPEKASEYIHLFTLLLRKTLALSEIDFTSFETEVAYSRDYLDMIQLRYGNQFHYEIKGEDHIDPQLVFPTMLLQPLLENATLHGLSESGHSTLILSFWLDQEWLYCSVCDNGIGIKASQNRKQDYASNRKSIGIQLLLDKATMLNQVYGIQLDIQWIDLAETTEDSGTRVQMRFKPLKNPPENAAK